MNIKKHLLTWVYFNYPASEDYRLGDVVMFNRLGQLSIGKVIEKNEPSITVRVVFPGGHGKFVVQKKWVMFSLRKL